MQWWSRILKKYKISDKTKIDVMNKLFYHCLTKDGKEEVEYMPKKVQSRLRRVKYKR
jgi:hypothetical protein